jgi:voltage-gated potassium channel
VVCGYGQVGETVADELAAARMPFVVLERDPERAEVAAKKGYAVHVGSAVDEEDLAVVRLGEAAGLVSTMSSEVENVYTVLSARETNPGIHIVARSSGPIADKKLRRVGANRVISPTSTGSRHMAHVLLRPTVSDFVEIAMSSTGAELQMEEIPIPARSKIIGQTLQASGLGRDYRVLVVAVKRADGTLNTVPPGSTEVQEGDVLLCIGSLDDLERLRRAWQRGG